MEAGRQESSKRDRGASRGIEGHHGQQEGSRGIMGIKGDREASRGIVRQHGSLLTLYHARCTSNTLQVLGITAPCSVLPAPVETKHADCHGDIRQQHQRVEFSVHLIEPRQDLSDETQC